MIRHPDCRELKRFFAAMAGKAGAVDGGPSSCRPPWFGTTMASAPTSAAMRASSGWRMPLMIGGPSRVSRTKSRSRHVTPGRKLWRIHAKDPSRREPLLSDVGERMGSTVNAEDIRREIDVRHVAQHALPQRDASRPARLHRIVTALGATAQIFEQQVKKVAMGQLTAVADGSRLHAAFCICSVSLSHCAL